MNAGTAFAVRFTDTMIDQVRFHCDIDDIWGDEEIKDFVKGAFDPDDIWTLDEIKEMYDLTEAK